MRTASDEASRDTLALQAWHDGEMGPLARWRFARRLARSGELQRELRMLESVGESVRDSEASVATPDVWSTIAGQLADIDAQRVEGEWERSRNESGHARGVGASFWKPVSAVIGAAAAVALAIGLFSGETAPSGVIHWVDGGSRNVMVLDGERDVTVIWVFDSLAEDAGRGGGRASA